MTGSFYRRYRPRRFGELRGQEHVVNVLRSAVTRGEVGHAWLFSGPRGTGKTSTARILAAALNCEDLDGGEPCGVCRSCDAVTRGASFDVFEHDAASHRKVEDIHELLASVPMSTPGRRKVYILDEVHQLTDTAVAALLKTLEEPPDHVVFVLATTDPHKVPETIRSRVQHLQFRLLSPGELERYVRDILDENRVVLDDATVAAVVTRGRGSARDTLSALDQAVTAGVLVDDRDVYATIVEGLIAGDTARVLDGVWEAVNSGRSWRAVAEGLCGYLRDMLIGPVAPHLLSAPGDRPVRQARRWGPANTARAAEAVSGLLTELRFSPDPRVVLETCLIRLTDRASDITPAGLAARVEHLEHAQAEIRTRTGPVNSGDVPVVSRPDRSDLFGKWEDVLTGLGPVERAVWSTVRPRVVDGNLIVHVGVPGDVEPYLDALNEQLRVHDLPFPAQPQHT